MRKSRIKITDVDEALIEILSNAPEVFLEHLEELSIKIPIWSKLLLVVLMSQKKTMEIAFFEDAKDFFLTYTKKALRYSSGSINFICFNCEENENWNVFIPPTLIGVNLRTRLRKKL